jgi:hypothetical protein
LEKAFSPDWRLQKRLVAPHDFEEMGFMFLVHTTLDEENIRTRSSNPMVDGVGQPGIGYLAILAA